MSFLKVKFHKFTDDIQGVVKFLTPCYFFCFTPNVVCPEDTVCRNPSLSLQRLSPLERSGKIWFQCQNFAQCTCHC